MLTYRLYFLDGSDHIVNVEIFKCLDDEQAQTVARQHINSLAVELWQAGRMIVRYERNLSP